MFESAEIGHRVGKKEFKARELELREALVDAQYRLLQKASRPVIVLVNGVDGAGKGETVNLLNAWMDPRHIRTEAFGPAREDERDRPEMWRFWQVMPARGRVGVLFGSWYSDPILSHVLGDQRKAWFSQQLERIRHFERMLVEEGVVLVKLWFHLSHDAARARLKALERDPKNSWRVSAEDWKRYRHYEEFVAIGEKALRKTNTADAPWHVIEGTDPAYRSLTAATLLLEALREAERPARKADPKTLPLPEPAIDGRTLLATADYSRALDAKRYARQLESLQARLAYLSRDPRMAARSMVLVFEGMDAAGKGSTIRRVTQALDSRYYRVIPVAAPTEEERAQPHLWRFWRRVPRHGHATIFDRSWYGRVLVERVEKFCAPADWLRAYDEINDFEEQLTEAGTIVVKFWMAVTPAEQLRRFGERKATPHKNFKITEEDWRNRKKWPKYELAVGDMMDRTSTDIAPWHVVASDDKLFSRIEVLRHLCERIESALGDRRKKARA
jgi:AMP-polyphosphate phosphotransferase